MPQQNEVGKKKHKVIQIDTEKAFDKIQHYFMIKILKQAGLCGPPPPLQSLFHMSKS